MKKSAIPTMVLAAFMGCLLLTGCGDGADKDTVETRLEKAAVEKINQENRAAVEKWEKAGLIVPTDPPVCTGVKISEKIDDTRYKATATVTTKLHFMVGEKGGKIEHRPISVQEMAKADKDIGDQSKLEKAVLEALKKNLKEAKENAPESTEVTAFEITGKIAGSCVGTATTVSRIDIIVEKDGDEVKVKPTEEYSLEKAAVEKLNEQLDEALKGRGGAFQIECTAVKITEQIDVSRYKATATMTAKQIFAIRKKGDEVEVVPVPDMDLLPEINASVGDQSRLEKAALEKLKEPYKEMAEKGKEKGASMECTAIKIIGKPKGAVDGYVGMATFITQGPVEIRKDGDEVTAVVFE